MERSLKYSNIILRVSLALVFVWFGVDKFFHPQYWLTVWVPSSVVNLVGHIGLSGTHIVYSIAVFEILTAISLAADMFVPIFASAAVVFLAVLPFFYGFNEIIVRDFGIIGALLALVFWPRPRRHS